MMWISIVSLIIGFSAVVLSLYSLMLQRKSSLRENPDIDIDIIDVVSVTGYRNEMGADRRGRPMPNPDTAFSFCQLIFSIKNASSLSNSVSSIVIKQKNKELEQFKKLPIMHKHNDEQQLFHKNEEQFSFPIQLLEMGEQRGFFLLEKPDEKDDLEIVVYTTRQTFRFKKAVSDFLP